MSHFNIPTPDGIQQNFLRAIGEALLWPSSSEKWREVLRMCAQNPGHEITRTILAGYGGAGGDVNEGLEIGTDWEERSEPRWLTRGFAAAEPGDVEQNLQARLERRRVAAMRRAAVKQREAIG
jgi:hypothetical protein